MGLRVAFNAEGTEVTEKRGQREVVKGYRELNNMRKCSIEMDYCQAILFL
jgi:hypothetical protein